MARREGWMKSPKRSDIGNDWYEQQYIQTNKNSCIHTYMHIHKKNIHTHIHTYIHTYLHTHTHIHTFIHTYVRTYIQTDIDKWIIRNRSVWELNYIALDLSDLFFEKSYIRTYIYTNIIHTYIHTSNIHTYIHTHT